MVMIQKIKDNVIFTTSKYKKLSGFDKFQLLLFFIVGSYIAFNYIFPLFVLTFLDLIIDDTKSNKTFVKWFKITVFTLFFLIMGLGLYKLYVE